MDGNFDWTPIYWAVGIIVACLAGLCCGVGIVIGVII